MSIVTLTWFRKCQVGDEVALRVCNLRKKRRLPFPCSRRAAWSPSQRLRLDPDPCLPRNPVATAARKVYGFWPFRAILATSVARSSAPLNERPPMSSLPRRLGRDRSGACRHGFIGAPMLTAAFVWLAARAGGTRDRLLRRAVQYDFARTRTRHRISVSAGSRSVALLP